MSAGARRARRAFASASATLVLAATTADAFAQRRLVVLEEPYGTVVAVSFLFDAGAAVTAGAGHVAAVAALEGVRPQIRTLGADATTTCGPGTVRFTLLAPPVTWRIATEMLLDALFVRHLGDVAIDSARATVLRQLERERGNPEREIESAVRQALYDSDHPRARPDCGRADAVASMSGETVRQVAHDIFQPGRAAAAVAGPVDGERARRLLAGALGDATRPIAATTPDRAPDTAERRHIVERQTVTAWTALAYRLPATPDRAALRFLAYTLERHFRPGPRRPELLGIRAAVERHGTGGAFVVYLSTPVATAAEWEDRVRRRMRRLADRRLDPEAFGSLLRRYRGVRLRSLATPEARARDAVRRAFFGHHYVDPVARIDGMTARRLRRAVASLGPPSTAVLGPR